MSLVPLKRQIATGSRGECGAMAEGRVRMRSAGQNGAVTSLCGVVGGCVRKRGKWVCIRN